MRKLNIQDAFDVAKLMKKAGLKDTVRELFVQGRKENASEESIGIELITSVVFACASEGVDRDFFKILGNITGNTPEEISQLPLEDLVDIFKRINAENNLVNFFKFAAKSKM